MDPLVTHAVVAKSLAAQPLAARRRRAISHLLAGLALLLWLAAWGAFWLKLAQRTFAALPAPRVERRPTTPGGCREQPGAEAPSTARPAPRSAVGSAFYVVRLPIRARPAADGKGATGRGPDAIGHRPLPGSARRT